MLSETPVLQLDCPNEVRKPCLVRVFFVRLSFGLADRVLFAFKFASVFHLEAFEIVGVFDQFQTKFLGQFQNGSFRWISKSSRTLQIRNSSGLSNFKFWMSRFGDSHGCLVKTVAIVKTAQSSDPSF